MCIIARQSDRIPAPFPDEPEQEGINVACVNKDCWIIFLKPFPSKRKAWEFVHRCALSAKYWKSKYPKLPRYAKENVHTVCIFDGIEGIRSWYANF